MNGHRVAITGVGLTCPLGTGLDVAAAALRDGVTGVRRMDAWDDTKGLVTRLGAVVPGEVEPTSVERKASRTMGRVALLATVATEQALAQAGLGPDDLASGVVGLAYGSTHGSTSAQEAFCRHLYGPAGLVGLKATGYLKFMSHTCAANLALHFGLRGRVTPIVSACTSASQAIGAGFEAIRGGLEEVMVCGGAEEMHVMHAAVFDLLYATSRRHPPEESPRPFDVDRDGLVVGEGAGTLVLERWDRAVARGAPILGEVLGYGTNCDGEHLTNPSPTGMRGAMLRALASAEVPADAVEYVNAHATATELGDIAESQATAAVFGPDVPVSSVKGATGHTLGACGAVEAALCLAMMRDGFLAPTRNLVKPDPRCGKLDHIIGDPRPVKTRLVVSNNFAFGGINTSLVLRAV
jgi:3-oxoacyl-[acyl-carrier-protein] synthase II